MKKFLLLFITLIAFSWQGSAQLSENFDGATFPPTDWTHTAGTGSYNQNDEIADHTTGSDMFARYDCYSINGGSPAYLTTPRLVVTAVDKTFSFWTNYYFDSGSFGEAAELYVDVSSDGGSTWTSGSTNYISGQHGAGWFSTTIDLTSYESTDFTGSNTYVRFKAISDYGSYNIAIDDVSGPALFVPFAIDAESFLVDPPSNPCPASTNETVVVTIANPGTSDIAIGAVSVALTGANNTPAVVNNPSVITSGNTLDVDVTGVDLSTAGNTYTLTATVTLAGDQDASNDSNSAMTTTSGVSATPMECDIEGFTGTNLNAICGNFAEASGSPTPAGTSSNWNNSSVLGTTTAKINLYTDDREEWIVSDNFTVGASDQLDMKIAITDYNSGSADPLGMSGTDDKVQVMISTDCGGSWTSLMEWNASNTGAITNSLVAITPVSLTAYSGQVAKIGVFATDGPTDDGPDYDFHIDDIFIGVPVSLDIKPTALIAPTDLECATALETITVEIENNAGGAIDFSVDNVTVTVNVSGAVTSTLSATLTSGTLAAGATMDVDMSMTLDMTPGGDYDFDINTTLVGDGNTGNDVLATITKSVANSGSGGTEVYHFSNSRETVLAAPTYDWIDPIAGGHTEVTSWSSGSDDDGYKMVTIGFPFTFYGTNYSDAYIGTNGYLSFGSGYTTAASGTEIGETTDPDNMIAAAMMDLDDRTDGKIYYATVGDLFIVTWYHYHDFSDDSEYMTFQVILQQQGADGVIVIQYNDTESTLIPDVRTDAVIGIEKGNGVDGLAYRENGAGGPIFCSPLAIAFSPNVLKLALPVELKSFTGYAMDQSTNILEWTTLTEKNTSMHIIERSTDGTRGFEEIGNVVAAGSSTTEVNYSLLDKKPLAIGYYRLKTIDMNGDVQFSNIISITQKVSIGEVRIFPIPASKDLTIQFINDVPEDVNITLLDINGRVVLDQPYFSTSGINRELIEVSHLSNGVYSLVIANGKNRMVKRVVIQK